MKRIMSVILAIIMVLSVLPISVLAAGEVGVTQSGNVLNAGWPAVEGATSYKVDVYKDSAVVSSVNVTTNSARYTVTAAGNYQFVVTANGTAGLVTYTSAVTAATYTGSTTGSTGTGTGTGLYVTAGTRTVYWNSVGTGATYTIYVNGMATPYQTVNVNSFTVPNGITLVTVKYTYNGMSGTVGSVTMPATGNSTGGTGVAVFSTVEFTIPIWAQYGYAVAGDSIKLSLPSTYSEGEYSIDASYVVVANGVSYSLGLNDDDVYDIVFGTLAHGYNTNDKNTVIPQSSVVGDNAALTVIGTFSIARDSDGKEAIRVSAADFKYYTDPSEINNVDSKFTTTFNPTTQRYDVKAISNDNSASVTYCWDWNPTDGVDIEAPALAGGTCGTNLTWVLTDDGMLTISGTGGMSIYNYWTSSSVPWYSYRSSIKSVVIEDGVTSIDDYAFSNCSKLTSVTIGNGVTNIGGSAFSGCSSLTSITIPDSVTSIGSGAFSNCSSLTSVTIPDSVTSICGSAFYNCTSLTSIDVPDGVTSIGDYAFYGCSSLTSITIPDSVTSIGYEAFYGCSSLTSVTIPDSVTSIGSSAFYDCSSLTSISIPDSVTSIGDYAFYRCSSLTSVTIPDSVTSISGSAFSGCSSLTSIDIPDGVTRIGESAFSSCSSLTSITIPDSVTRIGSYAFSGCSSLTSITIPDSVTVIGSYAFSSCNSLSKVYITDLEAWCKINFVDAYSNPLCQNLLGEKFYLNGEVITDLVIPEGIKSINAFAFIGCENIKTVTIPDSVTSIGDCAFYGCSSLTSIDIPDSVTSIGSDAFSYCSSLTSIDIPDSVTSIGDGAFSSCSKLTSISIPEGVTSIGNSIFNSCSSLTSVTIPNSVTSIGDSAFRGCSNLSSITIPDRLTSIGEWAFYGCRSLTSIDIPDSVTSIGGYAFYTCFSLTSITFNSPDTIIYNSADTISPTATIYGHEGSIAQAYAEKYNRKFNLIGATHECSFGPWEVYGWQSHIRYCTEDGCTVFEKNAHSFSSETDLSCNVCGYGNAEPDFTGDGTLDKNDAIYLLYHVLFGAESYPLTK